jgi:hypothetical protein
MGLLEETRRRPVRVLCPFLRYSLGRIAKLCCLVGDVLEGERVKKYLKLLRGKHWKPVMMVAIFLLSDFGAVLHDLKSVRRFTGVIQ